MGTYRRTITAGMLVAGLGVLAPAPAVGAADPDPNTFRQAVSTPSILGRLRELQAIAEENGGNRAVGTAGYDQSGEYVEAVLKKAGYQPKRQYFSWLSEQVKAASLTVRSPQPRALEQYPMSFSPGTAPEGITAALAVPTVVVGCSADDWGNVAATGKIALVARGGLNCTFAQKAKVARAAGAVGLIVYNNVEGPLFGSLAEMNDQHLPTTAISKADGEALVATVGKETVTATFVLDKDLQMKRTFNLIADTPQGRSDNVVMLGAHLDSVPNGPGINDNGSGSATLLEVAVRLAEAGHLNNRVRFAWWGAEELGLLGSVFYVNNLSATSQEALTDISAYLNFDMIASPNHVIATYDGDGSTFERNDLPTASPALEKIFTDYFRANGQSVIDAAVDDRSDYAPFRLVGIPFGGLFTGADGAKSRAETILFGGTRGLPYDPNYHTPKDTVANVDPQALDVMSDAVAHATFTLAQDTSALNSKGQAARRGGSASVPRTSPSTKGSASKVSAKVSIPAAVQAAIRGQALR